MRAQLAKTVMGHVQDAIARRKHLNELNENGVTLVSVLPIMEREDHHTLPPSLLEACHMQGSSPSHSPLQLHITAASGFHEAARLLLEHGATVDVRDCHGLTPLHVAAKFNQVGV